MASYIFDLRCYWLISSTDTEEVAYANACVDTLVTAPILGSLLLKASANSRILAHAKVVDHITLKEGLVSRHIVPCLRINFERLATLSILKEDAPHVHFSLSCIEAYLMD